MNVEFWAVKYDYDSFEWERIDRFALLSAAPMLSVGITIASIVTLL